MSFDTNGLRFDHEQRRLLEKSAGPFEVIEIFRINLSSVAKKNNPVSYLTLSKPSMINKLSLSTKNT